MAPLSVLVPVWPEKLQNWEKITEAKKEKKKGITLTSNWVVFMRDTDEKKIIDRVNLFKAKK